MRGVLIATDFVVKSDGTLTPLEINTNSGYELKVEFPQGETRNPAPDFTTNFAPFFNHPGFNSFLTSNNLTKIVTIDKPGGSSKIIESFCAHYNYEYEAVTVSEGSLTIPEIPDEDHKLIIRISYDTYALVDDIYARDMFEFHNLIKNEPFSSKVSFNTGNELNIDTIDQFEPSIDGIVPNYIVKPRLPGYPRGIYPKLYRLETAEELSQLKQTIGENEFIQKYEFNQSKTLVENRISFIRSMDLIYGPELEVINILKYKSINAISTQNTLLRFDSELMENKRLDPLFAGKWHPKYDQSLSLQYHFDETDEILMPDNSVQLASELSVNDFVSGIRFNEKIRDFQIAPVSDLQNFSRSPSRIVSIRENQFPGIFINITASDTNGNSYSWYDGVKNKYLIMKQGSEYVQYLSQDSGQIEIGDSVFVFDETAETPNPLQILDIYYDIKGIKTFEMSLENDYREFFIKLDNSIYLLQHNFGTCDPFCGVSYNCSSTTFWGAPLCNGCDKNSINCPICTPSGNSSVCNSDERVKENLILIGKSRMGINIYRFNYKGESEIYEGVIAQELIDTEFSSAIIIGEDGLYKVDYSKIDVEFKKIN